MYTAAGMASNPPPTTVGQPASGRSASGQPASGRSFSGGRSSPSVPPKPLEGASLALLTVALALAAFMQVLDSTIANVAIPTIAGNLGASSSQGTWVITSFGVANAVALPLTGWLAKRFGEVRLFLWAAGLFVLASFLCGIAWSLEMLIVFRVMQGVVAGPMMPLSQSLLMVNYPHAKRPLALSLWSMTVVVAPIFGPILGGWISDNYQWGWIFFINVPVGALVLLLCRVLLAGRETATVKSPLNRVGLVLLVIGVGSLQLMLDRGKELDWFNSPEIIILAVTAVVGLSLLVAWELTDKNPIVDFTLFRSRNFSIGVACISLTMLIYFGTIVVIPLMLQKQMGYTATLAGLAAAPIGILPVLLATAIGKNAHRVDMRLLATVSFVVFALCFLWRTTFSPHMDFAWVAMPQFLQGLAVACFFMPVTSIAFADLAPGRLAAASSLSNFLRVLSCSMGTSLTIALWERREALHHARLAEAVTAFNPLAGEYLGRLTRLGLSEAQSQAYVAGEITRQSFIMAANDIFGMCAALMLLMIAVVWFSKPRAGAAADTGGAH